MVILHASIQATPLISGYFVGPEDNRRAHDKDYADYLQDWARRTEPMFATRRSGAVYTGATFGLEANGPFIGARVEMQVIPRTELHQALMAITAAFETGDTAEIATAEKTAEELLANQLACDAVASGVFVRTKITELEFSEQAG